MRNNAMQESERERDIQDESIHVVDLLIVLAKHKRMIVGAPLVAAVIAAGVSLLLPNSYQGTVQLLPPQSQSSASSMLGQLGALGSLAGGGLGGKNSNELYIGMLQSRTVIDRMVQRFGMQAAYGARTAAEARRKLQDATTMTGAKSGLLVIDVLDIDPQRAADLANGYVDELLQLTQTLAVTEASQRRLFFDKQLQAAKQSLSDAEVALKSVQEKTGLIQLSGQAEAVIRAAADLKAQIASREVSLGVLRSFSTAANPEVLRTQQELAGLRGELNKLETGVTKGKGDVLISTSRVPAAGLDYVRKTRDVKYNEAIFEMLAKQLELARIDEAKESAVVQVLDKAIAADRKVKPSRGLIVLIAALGTTALAVLLAFIKESLANAGADRRQIARLDRLRASLRWK